jgi:hypothetical protein
MYLAVLTSLTIFSARYQGRHRARRSAQNVYRSWRALYKTIRRKEVAIAIMWFATNDLVRRNCPCSLQHIAPGIAAGNPTMCIPNEIVDPPYFRTISGDPQARYRDRSGEQIDLTLSPQRRRRIAPQTQHIEPCHQAHLSNGQTTQAMICNSSHRFLVRPRSFPSLTIERRDSVPI